MYNADRLEGFGKLARYMNLLPEKDRTGPAWPIAPYSYSLTHANDTQQMPGPYFRRPFRFDDDTNLSLLSAAFFLPKGVISDLLLSQYLFKSGT